MLYVQFMELDLWIGGAYKHSIFWRKKGLGDTLGHANSQVTLWCTAAFILNGDESYTKCMCYL